MSATLRQYGFAIIFFGVGIFQLVKRDVAEATLYMLAASAFVFNNLASSPKLIAYKRPLVIITWCLIIAVAVLFLYLLQFRHL